MALDYGSQPTRSGRFTERATMVAAVVLLAATIPLALLGQRQAAIGRILAWTFPGPPCPTVSHAVAAAYGAHLGDPFSFQGLRYRRGYGNASCAMIPADRVLGLGEMPICQFDGPGVVEVSGPRRQTLFMAGMAPTTITIDNGQPHCVLGARLTPDWRRN